MVKSENRPKFLCLLNSFAYLSGGDIRFVEIFRRLNQQVAVITPAIGENFCRSNKLNAVYHQTSHEKYAKHILTFYMVRILRAILFMNKDVVGDVVYATSDCLPDTLPCFIARLRHKNVRWVQLIHHIVPNRKPDSELRTNLRNLLSFLSQRICFFLIKRTCDLIITINPIVKNDLKELGFNDDLIKVNSNGVDLESIRRAIDNKEIGYDGVFIGRLHASKGLFDLVSIWHMLCKKRPAKLAIIGSGDERIVDKLKREIEIRGLRGKVDLLGFIESEKAYSIMKSSKLFVFPSHEEGFGIVILEAMACKLPVIAYDLPTYDSIFGENILRIPKYDYSRFVETMNYFLSNDISRAELGLKGFRFVQSYDWNRVSKEELRLLRKLMV